MPSLSIVLLEIVGEPAVLMQYEEVFVIVFAEIEPSQAVDIPVVEPFIVLFSIVAETLLEATLIP